MFSQPELRLFRSDYFRILRTYDNYIEIQSRNTGHCWIVQKLKAMPGVIVVNHKHSISDKYYHKHRHCSYCWKALREIQRHDDYVLSRH